VSSSHISKDFLALETLILVVDTKSARIVTQQFSKKGMATALIIEDNNNLLQITKRG
jgi:hypothetical protein